jgi:S1-C subfamily serine protease
MKTLVTAIALSTVLSVSPVMAQTYVNHDDSVVKIEMHMKDRRGNEHKGSGTGWYIGQDRFITNAHVVIKDDAMSYENKDGKVIKLKVLAKDDEKDVAVLHADEPVDLPVLKITTDVPQIGTEVESIGFAAGMDVLHFWARVASKEINLDDEDETGKKLEHPVIKVGSPAIGGMSGGPILNAKGEVVGMTEAAWPVSPASMMGGGPGTGPVNFFIPAHVVLDIIKKSQEKKNM